MFHYGKQMNHRRGPIIGLITKRGFFFSVREKFFKVRKTKETAISLQGHYNQRVLSMSQLQKKVDQKYVHRM